MGSIPLVPWQLFQQIQTAEKRKKKEKERVKKKKGIQSERVSYLFLASQPKWAYHFLKLKWMNKLFQSQALQIPALNIIISK